MRSGALIAAWLLFAGGAVAAPPVDLGSEAQRAAGKKLYDAHCSQCHGE
jgi:mono/diheme cytochrome c family protein